MKVWITRYALSQGIEEVDGEVSEIPSILTYGRHGIAFDEGRQWHRTREEAVVRAEAMRLAKIASLERQIAKFKKMRFE